MPTIDTGRARTELEMSIAAEALGAQQAASAPEHDGLLSGERRALTIGLVLVVTLVGFEALAVATAMPVAKDDLGGLRLYGWTFSAFLLASLVGITWAGEQCDRHGVVRPFSIGLTLFAAGLALASIAPAMWVLVAARAVQGLGAGVVPAVAYVVIGRAYDDAMRPKMFAVLSSAWVIPGLVGPAVAGAVAEYVSWRLVFAGLLPILAIAVALTLPALRAMRPPDPQPATESRLVRSLLLMLGAAMIIAGLTAARTPWIAVPLAIAGGAIAVPALRRLLPAGTLHAAAGLPATIVAHALLNMAFFGSEAFLPLMLTDIRDLSAPVAGIALTSAALSWTGGSWILSHVAGRVDRPTTGRIGLALVVVGIGGLALGVLESMPAALVVLLPWGVAGLGMGLAYSSFSLLLLAEAPEGEVGAVTSSFKLAEVLGPALGAGFGGALVAAGDSGDWQASSIALTFGVMMAIAVLGLAAALRVRGGVSTARS